MWHVLVYDAPGRLLKEYEPEAGGTYAQIRYTYNTESQVIRVDTERVSGVTLADPPPQTPTLAVPPTGPSGNYTVSWTSEFGTDSYSLEESTNGTTWAVAYSGSALSKAFSARPGGSYFYRVSACNQTGCSVVSALDTVEVGYPPADAPTLNAPLQLDDGAYKLYWNARAGAETYQLQESKNNAAWKVAQDAADTDITFVDKVAATYRYKVSACNALGGCGPFSAIVTRVQVAAPSAAPTLTVPTSNSTGTYTLSWTAVSGASAYQLYRRLGSGSWAKISDDDIRSETESGRSSGTYSYYVRACNGGGCGPNSAVKSVTVSTALPAVPTLSVPSPTTHTVSPSWTSVASATSYQLEENANGSGNWTSVYNGMATSTSFFRNNGSYSYRVKACNANGCGAYSSTKSIFIDIEHCTTCLMSDPIEETSTESSGDAP
jgi:hypothetical protein